MASLPDIQGRSDIEFIVAEFYKQVVSDDTIGTFFTEVVKLNFEIHLPVICDFWETTLLDTVKYKGNPMLKHLELSKKSKLKPQHFVLWLGYWESTIRTHYQGVISEQAITRAQQIAELMQFKLGQQGLGSNQLI